MNLALIEHNVGRRRGGCALATGAGSASCRLRDLNGFGRRGVLVTNGVLKLVELALEGSKFDRSGWRGRCGGSGSDG